MRCCICARDCEASTKNFPEGGWGHETEMEKNDLDRSAGDRGDSHIYRHWRRNRAAPVELAAAVAVRMAADYLLAGARTAAVVPDSVRRPWSSRLPSFEYAFQDAASNGRAVGADDAGRTRTGPRALEPLRIQATGAETDDVSPHVRATSGDVQLRECNAECDHHGATDCRDETAGQVEVRAYLTGSMGERT